MLTHDKSLPGLWPGELKIVPSIKISIIHIYSQLTEDKTVIIFINIIQLINF